MMTEQSAYREEILDLREKLFDAEKHRLNGAKTYSIDEVNRRLEDIIKDKENS